MRGIWFREQGLVSAVGVELPDEGGRLGEGLGRGEGRCFVPSPPSPGTAEGLHGQRARRTVVVGWGVVRQGRRLRRDLRRRGR
jgi:hypothetical protein